MCMCIYSFVCAYSKNKERKEICEERKCNRQNEDTRYILENKFGMQYLHPIHCHEEILNMKQIQFFSPI